VQGRAPAGVGDDTPDTPDHRDADAALVQRAESLLAGVVGGAAARVMIASVVEEETLAVDDVLRIVEEATELRHLNEQLRSLDRLKDDFVSSVTHELRTPLTSIRAFAELIRDDPAMPPEERQAFVGLIVAETERLTRLVNQVLDLAKIDSGHAAWRSADVDLRELVQRAVDTTAELFRERGAAVSLELPGRMPTLRADPDRLMQVMMNLLSNAAKFVPAGDGRVAVRLKDAPGGLVVEVEDNGPGVPREQQDLVFERFRQGGDGRQRPQGTGLGLPISRQIVEHFGGRLWVRSAPETGRPGACFGFFLPWPPAAAPVRPGG
jgi:signal transduction histidine kinase